MSVRVPNGTRGTAYRPISYGRTLTVVLSRISADDAPTCTCTSASTARASCYIYNTTDEVDRLLEVIREIQKFFGG